MGAEWEYCNTYSESGMGQNGAVLIHNQSSIVRTEWGNFNTHSDSGIGGGVVDTMVLF